VDDVAVKMWLVVDIAFGSEWLMVSLDWISDVG